MRVMIDTINKCFCGLPLRKHPHCPVCRALCGPGHPEQSHLIQYRGARICPECCKRWEAIEKREKSTLTYTEFKTGSRKPELKQSGQLTTREIKILRMIYRGFSNKQIAWELKVSVIYIENLIGKILLKLQAHSRTEAVYKAIKLNIKMED